MSTSPANSLKLIAKAAAFAFVAIGGMATGLGLTTYSMAKANDMVVASVASGPATGVQPKSCYLK